MYATDEMDMVRFHVGDFALADGTVYQILDVHEDPLAGGLFYSMEYEDDDVCRYYAIDYDAEFFDGIATLY